MREGSILAMHVFCLALLYHVHPVLATLTGVPASEIRHLLGDCLDNMKAQQRASVVFLKAREALDKFTRKLDSICKCRLFLRKHTFWGILSDFQISRPKRATHPGYF